MLVASAIGLVGGSVLMAQYPMGRYYETEEIAEARVQQAAVTEEGLIMKRTSRLIGQSVRDSQGKELGSIHDLVLTPDLRRVSYVALARGGVWGIGSDLYAVPWSAFQFDVDYTVVLDVSEQQFENTEGFNRGQWPGRPDPQWAQMYQGQMRRQQGHTGQVATQHREVQGRRVTRLTGLDVRNDEGEDIGSIEDFVVAAAQRAPAMQGEAQQEQQNDEQARAQDAPYETEGVTQGGHLLYTVVGMGGFWGFGQEYALVPSNAVDIQPHRDDARLDADKETLEAIAFDPGQWPDLSSRSYARQLHDRFDERPYWIVLGYIATPEEQAAAWERAWAADSEYARLFDADKIKTIEGTVDSVGTFRPASGVREGLRLRVRADEDKIVTVHAGPHWYAQQKEFLVRTGDEIRVTGSEATIRDRSVILSSKIESGDKTLELRDDEGKPKWKREGSESMQR
jgi:sporulation protein YlmC with PRC-barrel domain